MPKAAINSLCFSSLHSAHGLKTGAGAVPSLQQPNSLLDAVMTCILHAEAALARHTGSPWQLVLPGAQAKRCCPDIR